MPDETTAQPTDVAETPQGAEETDWKAESRKHERREKENASKVRELQERLAKYEAADEDRRKQAEDADRKRSDELEKLKAENQQLKETAERERMVRAVAKDTGADAEILLLMNPADETTARDYAAKLLESIGAAAPKSKWPDIKDHGESKAPATKDEILAIEDKKERRKAIRENIALFEH